MATEAADSRRDHVSAFVGSGIPRGRRGTLQHAKGGEGRVRALQHYRITDMAALEQLRLTSNDAMRRGG